MKKQTSAFGFKMSEKQMFELDDLLKEDILVRYNNNEYWDSDIIETFAHDNKLKRSK